MNWKTSFSRRDFLRSSALATGAGLTAPLWPLRLLAAAAPDRAIAGGPFQPTWDSLLQNYRCPEWFRDAKFGIWSVWGPQAVPEQGDWYAREMYEEGSAKNKYHVAHYGHPSKFGYKDIIALWRGEKWDPARLMGLYQQAGARYFVVMANHHDNYDLWNSKHHPKWNSVQTGPRQDIVGRWREQALQAGLRFGVTEHNARSYCWLQTSHGADKQGPMAGVPYDGADPRYQDLYHPPFPSTDNGYPIDPPESWTTEWYDRSRDLLDTYQPDLFYFDGGVPFGDVGLRLVTHFYNANARWHGGRMEAVLCVKKTRDGTYIEGTCVRDLERGTMDAIPALPWQTDTCIGDWFYKKNVRYKSAKDVIHLLVDIVSKNGNLLLNAPLAPDGTLDAEAERTLAGIGRWLAVNGEAIYGTRPFGVYGEGLNTSGGEMFSENNTTYGAQDIRFTTKPSSLYAIVLGWPEIGEVRIHNLASNAPHAANCRFTAVSLLGTDGRLEWTRDEEGLRVKLPARPTGEPAYALRIATATG